MPSGSEGLTPKILIRGCGVLSSDNGLHRNESHHVQYFHYSHVSLDCSVWEPPEAMKGHKFDSFVKQFNSAHPSDPIVLKSGNTCIIEWVDTKRKSLLLFDLQKSEFIEHSLASVRTYGSHSAPVVEGLASSFV